MKSLVKFEKEKSWIVAKVNNQEILRINSNRYIIRKTLPFLPCLEIKDATNKWIVAFVWLDSARIHLI